eukprot:565106-Rhodomonas_salina.2
MLLPFCDAMSGTEIGYAATRLHPIRVSFRCCLAIGLRDAPADVAHSTGLSAYARAMRCPVLS